MWSRSTSNNNATARNFARCQRQTTLLSLSHCSVSSQRCFLRSDSKGSRQHSRLSPRPFQLGRLSAKSLSLRGRLSKKGWVTGKGAVGACCAVNRYRERETIARLARLERQDSACYLRPRRLAPFLLYSRFGFGVIQYSYEKWGFRAGWLPSGAGRSVRVPPNYQIESFISHAQAEQTLCMVRSDRNRSCT